MLSGDRLLLAGILLLIRSVFCQSDPIRSGPVRSDPIRSDPIRSDPGFANGLNSRRTWKKTQEGSDPQWQ